MAPTATEPPTDKYPSYGPFLVGVMAAPFFMSATLLLWGKIRALWFERRLHHEGKDVGTAEAVITSTDEQVVHSEDGSLELGVVSYTFVVQRADGTWCRVVAENRWVPYEVKERAAVAKVKSSTMRVLYVPEDPCFCRLEDALQVELDNPTLSTLFIITYFVCNLAFCILLLKDAFAHDAVATMGTFVATCCLVYLAAQGYCAHGFRRLLFCGCFGFERTTVTLEELGQAEGYGATV